MEKISGIANLLAIALAIIAGIIAIPGLDAGLAILILAVIGGLAADQDSAIRVYLAVLVLPAVAAAVAGIPAVGEYLAAIFSNVGIAAAGVAATLITRRLIDMVKDGVGGLSGGSAS